MEIKNLFPKKEKECKIKGPWVIEEIQNGLKARSMKLVGGMVVGNNKKIPVQYFEYDRIFGRGAFDEILRVMDMFDELRNLTPRTIGYIFKENSYLHHDQGILKRNNKTKVEDYFSAESLRNENLANYLQLNCTQNPDEEEDTDRGPVHSACTELQTTQN